MVPVLAEQAKREAAAASRKKWTSKLIRYALIPALLVSAIPAYRAYILTKAEYMPYIAAGMTKQETYDYLAASYEWYHKNKDVPLLLPRKLVPEFFSQFRQVYLYGEISTGDAYQSARSFRNDLLAALEDAQAESMLIKWDPDMGEATYTYRYRAID